jgi:sporulation integral membrane protein YlbJ
LALVIYPKEGYQAAVDGMKIFWDVVFPSLLPFFVLSEILLGLGVVHFLGVLLEPLMRPLFNVPGVGAFALSMGLAAGYPMDAVITSRFRHLGLCTKTEGERLLAFTNTADPLFILGAVAVGMFMSPRLGITLAIAHYLSSFTVGILFKFYRSKDIPTPELGQAKNVSMLRRAARELLKARRNDGRPFGKLFSDSVKESITTLFMICGYIMLFSVVVKVADLARITMLFNPVIGAALRTFHLDPSLTDATFRGLLEIDLGTMATSKALASLVDKAVEASFIIGWSGLSVHAQVASVVAGSDIRFFPYVVARVLHGLFAGFYTWVVMVPLGSTFGWSNLPVFERISHGVVLGPVSISNLVVEKWVYGGLAVIGFVGFMTLGSVVVVARAKLKELARPPFR